MKRVKATIEVLVDVEDWVSSEDYFENYGKPLTKKVELEKIKEELQDLEVLMNNIRPYKVISVKETKQKEFKY